jgi:hypothetical protein
MKTHADRVLHKRFMNTNANNKIEIDTAKPEILQEFYYYPFGAN